MYSDYTVFCLEYNITLRLVRVLILETHKAYSLSDSDAEYETSPRLTNPETSISTQSVSKSRVTPRVDDVQLQHLEIENESSDDDRPQIMADEDFASDEELPVFQSRSENKQQESIFGLSVSSKKKRIEEATVAAKDEAKPKTKSKSEASDDVLSSDDEMPNQMVSEVKPSSQNTTFVLSRAVLSDSIFSHSIAAPRKRRSSSSNNMCVVDRKWRYQSAISL